MSEVAFGGHPGVSVARGGRTGPVVRWTAAVALGGQGRYAAAAGLLEGLLRDPRVPVEIRAHALVTHASHLRQRGGHALAERFDGQALALVGAVPGERSGAVAGPAGEGPSGDAGPSARTGPTAGGPASADARPSPVGAADPGGTEVPGPDHSARGTTVSASPCADLLSARVDALSGLAADALGQGALVRSARLLSRADGVLAGSRPARVPDGSPPWRPAVRAAWVHAELALALGGLNAASAAAARAVRGAATAGSLRHLLKSRLLAAVVASVRAVPGSDDGPAEPAVGVVAPTPEAALAALDAVAEEAAVAGLLPLAWAALLAAADAATTVAWRAGASSAPSSLTVLR